MRFVAIRSRGAPDTDLGPIELADALFFPVTEALSTVQVRRVRFTLWLDGEDIQVWPAIQYSNDAANWSTHPIGVPSVATGGTPPYTATKWNDTHDVWEPLGWLTPSSPREPTTDRTVQTDWYDCPGDFQDVSQSASSPTYLSEDRLFCRLGIVALNATADSSGPTPPRGGRAALQVEFSHVTGGTILGGPALCPSGGGNGSTATSVFTPLTGALATANLGEVRTSLETQATDAVSVTLGYQTSEDGMNWSATTTLTATGTPTRTSDGISYPTQWGSFAVSGARYVRFGAVVVNASGSDEEVRGVVVTIRVDWREA